MKKKYIVRKGIAPARIGTRLGKLRKSYGWRQNQIAHQVGISGPSWNKYEQGQQVISVYHASAIKCKTGATLDWIYHGSIEALPLKLIKRLQYFEKNKKAAP